MLTLKTLQFICVPWVIAYLQLFVLSSISGVRFGGWRWFSLAVFLNAAVTPDEVTINQLPSVNAVVLLNQIIPHTQAAIILIKKQMPSPFHALDIKNQDSVILDLQGT